MIAHLQDVVLGHRCDDPVVAGIPSKVGDLGGVAAVDEEQLRRAILRILRGLQQMQGCPWTTMAEPCTAQVNHRRHIMFCALEELEKLNVL
jgi:hypothetical protein